MTMMLLAALGGTASAGVDCPHPVKRHHKKKHHRVPVKPKAPPSCSCIGQEGPQGPRGLEGPQGQKGEKGDPGETTYYLVEVKTSTFTLAGGVLYAVHVPHGDWAWGPGIQLRRTTPDGIQLDVALATASIADGTVGNESGWLGQLGLTKLNEEGVGLGVGLHITDIAGSKSNGDVDGRYLGVDGHITVQRPLADSLSFRFEAGPVLSYLRDDVDGKQFAAGLESSVFVGGDL